MIFTYREIEVDLAQQIMLDLTSAFDFLGTENYNPLVMCAEERRIEKMIERGSFIPTHTVKHSLYRLADAKKLDLAS